MALGVGVAIGLGIGFKKLDPDSDTDTDLDGYGVIPYRSNRSGYRKKLERLPYFVVRFPGFVEEAANDVVVDLCPVHWAAFHLKAVDVYVHEHVNGHADEFHTAFDSYNNR